LKAKILNVDTSFAWGTISHRFNLKLATLNFPDIVSLYQRGGNISCGTAVTSTVLDCKPTGWCISQYPEHRFDVRATHTII
jgi:hypothetical protein